jgi:uncharacterized protein involved in response to NO
MSGVAVAEAAGRTRRGFALFEQGLRPFFLLAGLWAPLGVLVWVSALAGLPVPQDGPLPLLRWHAHEMLGGFAAAALGGFVLTAVPNWTGRRGYGGAPLMALVALFIAGRLALLPWSPLPAAVAAPLALAFLPALLLTVLPALVKAGSARLFGPPALVLAFWAGDALMLGEAAGWWEEGWRAGQMLCANMALALVVLIGGRIIPSFTLNALRKTSRPAEPHPLVGVDPGAVLSVLGVAMVDLVAPGGVVAGALAAVAAVLVALRLSRWHGLRTLRQPILWVLHLAYAFVPLALAMKAASILASAPWATNWLHLQGAGALALMIMAVMTRAALGHTGRALVAAPPTVLAYVLLALAALTRGFAPVLAGGLLPLAVAGALWVLAFALFLIEHTPVLLRPRPDGKPG